MLKGTYALLREVAETQQIIMDKIVRIETAIRAGAPLQEDDATLYSDAIQAAAQGNPAKLVHYLKSGKEPAKIRNS